MRPQGFAGVIVARKFGFGQSGVDFLVADLMQQHRLAALAAAQAWDQVVAALRDIVRDRPATKRTYRSFIVQFTCLRIGIAPLGASKSRGFQYSWKVRPNSSMSR